MGFLKKYTLHCFLFIPFVALFLFNKNFESVTFAMTWRTMGIGLLLSVLLFFAGKLVFRSNTKAAAFTTLLLLLFFNYGAIYEALESSYYQGVWPFKNIHRYLVGFYLVLLLAVSVYLFRTKRTLFKLNYSLNIFVLLLLLYNAVSIIAKSSGSKPVQEAHKTTSPLPQGDSCKSCPDIYYIILDGYANQHVLKKYYQYDNSAFIHALHQKGFFIADSAASNYYATIVSLASTLNQNYMGTEHASEHIANNTFFAFMRQRGYMIRNLASGYLVTAHFSDADETIEVNGPNEFERGILKHTILRLDDLFGFFSYKRLKGQFDKLSEMAIPKGSRPAFNFIHVVCPHPPYVFNRDGSFRIAHSYNENSWDPREHYADQLAYTNTQVLAFVEKLLALKEKPVVIIQSDHGPWIQSPSEAEVFEARSKILNAMLVPDTSGLYRSISSVNTFRYLRRTLFGDSTLTLLRDSAAGEAELKRSVLFRNKLSGK